MSTSTVAQHPALCPDCDTWIQVGDRITRPNPFEAWRHASCPRTKFDFDPDTVCPGLLHRPRHHRSLQLRMSPLLATALELHAAGLSVVPVAADGTKRPASRGSSTPASPPTRRSCAPGSTTTCPRGLASSPGTAMSSSSKSRASPWLRWVTCSSCSTAPASAPSTTASSTAGPNSPLRWPPPPVPRRGRRRPR